MHGCSRSLSRLENTIEPMADKVDDMHDKLNGDLNVKITEMHHLMLSMASADSTPRAWSSRSESVASSAGAPLEELQRSQLNSFPAPNRKSPERFSTDDKPRQTQVEAAELEGREHPSPLPIANLENACSVADPHINRRETTTIPLGGCMSNLSESPPQLEYDRNRQRSHRSPRSSSGSSQAVETYAHRRKTSDLPSPTSPGIPMMLPLPSIAFEPEEKVAQADPYDFSMVTATEHAPMHLTSTTTTEAQYLAFQKAITEDAAVLCQV